MKLAPWPCTPLEFDASNPSGNSSLGCSGDEAFAPPHLYKQSTIALCGPCLLGGGVLLTAAGLKGLEAVINPLVGGPFFGTRWDNTSCGGLSLFQARRMFMPPSALENVIIWKGDANGDWTNAANWQRTAGMGDCPGAGDAFDDLIVLVDNSTPKACDPARDQR